MALLRTYSRQHHSSMVAKTKETEADQTMTPYQEEIINSRYLWHERKEKSWEEAALRISRAVFERESNPNGYIKRLQESLTNFEFLPGGRVLRNAGRSKGNLINCVGLKLEDDTHKIGMFIHDSLMCWKKGAGIGFVADLRPKGADLVTDGDVSSGVVSWLRAINGNGQVIRTGGQRRTAALCMFWVTHPEVLDVMDAKLKEGDLDCFNISIIVTNDFLETVERNGDWKFTYAGKDYGSMPAREIWDKIVNNMIHNGEPGLINWDNFVKNNSYYFAPVETANACGEQPMEGYGACCLGALNLTKFVTEGGSTKRQLLEDRVRLAVRVLDNVLDISYYPLSQIEAAAQASRRIGLGTMGLAELHFMKEIRYGSEESLEMVDKIYTFIRDVAYDESVNLSREKGSFPRFDPSAFGRASFVRKLPQSLRRDIKEHGIRNVALLSGQPTGCLTKDTMVVTNHGLERLDEIGSVNNTRNKWQSINRIVATDSTPQICNQFYMNGWKGIRVITLENGLVLKGTLNHKVKNENDDWVSLGNLREGQIIKLAKNTWLCSNEPELKKLDIMDLYYEKKSNNNIIRYPTKMTIELAEVLGLLWADGSIKNDRVIRLTIADDEKEIDKLFQEKIMNLFGIPCYSKDERRPNNKSFTRLIHSKSLCAWLDKNELLKGKAHELSIPKLIRSSNSEIICAFLRGLFTGDGCIRKSGKINLSSVSKRLIKEIQIILLSLGISSRLVITNNRKNAFGNRSLFGLELHNRDVFRDKIGFLSDKKASRLNSINFRESNFGNSIFSKVRNIEFCYKNTYDLSVPVGNTYIANGFVSHNTTALVADTSSGIEPIPSLFHRREDRVSSRVYIHPRALEYLVSKRKLPGWLTDAVSLSPEDHINLLVRVLKRVDSNVSKTVNLVAGTTSKTLSAILLEAMWDLKSITVYVDGSRKKQVIYPMNAKEAIAYLKQKNPKLLENPAEIECKGGVCEL